MRHKGKQQRKAEERKRVCCNCSFQQNNPSYCDTKEEFVGRKGKPCESHTFKS